MGIGIIQQRPRIGMNLPEVRGPKDGQRIYPRFYVILGGSVGDRREMSTFIATAPRSRLDQT